MGLVTAGDTTGFRKNDGTWATPATGAAYSVFSTTSTGLVPAGDTTGSLKNNGTWANPATAVSTNNLQANDDASAAQTVDVSAEFNDLSQTGATSTTRLIVANDGRVAIGKNPGPNLFEVGGSVKAVDYKFPNGDGDEVSLVAMYGAIVSLPAMAMDITTGSPDLVTSGGVAAAIKAIAPIISPVSDPLPREFAIAADTDINASGSAAFLWKDPNGATGTTVYAQGITHEYNQARFKGREAGQYVIYRFL